MDPKELIQRSPLRALDSALEGGLGRGNLGVVIARHGGGKTPFLVGIALDHLLRGERVLHVSLDQKVDHVREFYDTILDDLARTVDLGHHPELRLELERRRHIHTYLGGSFQTARLAEAVTFSREHTSFEPAVLVLDGFDFSKARPADVEALGEIARRADAELWMTAVRHRDEKVTDPDGIPDPVAAFKGLAKVIISLQTDGDVRATLLKPAGRGELPFVLDRTTMLVKQK